MAVADKSGVYQRAATGEPLTLELGCGPRKRHHDAIGVDRLDYTGVDLVGDVFEALAGLPENSVTAVYSYHFFEHVEDCGALLEAVARVMRPGGQLLVVVPHFSNPYFYSDPTHSRFFGLYTFSYLAADNIFRRRVPQYGRVPRFEVEDVKLGFDSPFPVRGLIKRCIGRVFNLTRGVQEFYEENLCYLFPCFELRFELRRLPEQR